MSDQKDNQSTTPSDDFKSQLDKHRQSNIMDHKLGSVGLIHFDQQVRSLLEQLLPFMPISSLGGPLVGAPIAVNSTPYTMAPPYLVNRYAVTTGASNIVFNLASAASLTGIGLFTIEKVDSGVGVVQVVPNGTDSWVFGGGGNISLYLGNQGHSITFAALGSGILLPISGAYDPAHGVDTNGSGYVLGKLHHLPQVNTASRGPGSKAVPTTGTWSSAVQITGNYGVPAGAKAVRLQVYVLAYAAAAGRLQCQLFFGDSTSDGASAGVHIYATPQYVVGGHANAAGYYDGPVCELDAPLNSLGQLFVYGGTYLNLTVASCSYYITAVGYYMGD